MIVCRIFTLDGLCLWLRHGVVPGTREVSTKEGSGGLSGVPEVSGAGGGCCCGGPSCDNPRPRGCLRMPET